MITQTPDGRKYVILRGVENGSRVWADLPAPVTKKNLDFVCTLISEDKLKQFGLHHFHSVFIEERMHDYDLNEKNQFRFYGHSGAKGDLHDLVFVYK